MLWNDKMTVTMKIIKEKIQNLPKLHLHDVQLPFVLEIDAFDEVWATILLQRHPK